MFAKIEIYFLINPVFNVLKTTGISPVSPGLMGFFGQPLRTVHPQPAFTEFIKSGVYFDNKETKEQALRFLFSERMRQ